MGSDTILSQIVPVVTVLFEKVRHFLDGDVDLAVTEGAQVMEIRLDKAKPHTAKRLGVEIPEIAPRLRTSLNQILQHVQGLFERKLSQARKYGRETCIIFTDCIITSMADLDVRLHKIFGSMNSNTVLKIHFVTIGRKQAVQNFVQYITAFLRTNERLR